MFFYAMLLSLDTDDRDFVEKIFEKYHKYIFFPLPSRFNECIVIQILVLCDHRFKGDIFSNVESASVKE